MNHDLKTWPVYFEAQLKGDKPFELRRHDRNFAIGDTITSREYYPEENRYSDRCITGLITYIATAQDLVPGLMPGFCILGIKVLATPGGSSPPIEWLETATLVWEKPLREEVAEQEGKMYIEAETIYLACDILEVTPVAQIVEDALGEIHTLSGDQMAEGAREGMKGVLVRRKEGALFLKLEPIAQS